MTSWQHSVWTDSHQWLQLKVRLLIIKVQRQNFQNPLCPLDAVRHGVQRVPWPKIGRLKQKEKSILLTCLLAGCQSRRDPVRQVFKRVPENVLLEEGPEVHRVIPGRAHHHYHAQLCLQTKQERGEAYSTSSLPHTAVPAKKTREVRLTAHHHYHTQLCLQTKQERGEAYSTSSLPHTAVPAKKTREVRLTAHHHYHTQLCLQPK